MLCFVLTAVYLYFDVFSCLHCFPLRRLSVARIRHMVSRLLHYYTYDSLFLSSIGIAQLVAARNIHDIHKQT